MDQGAREAISAGNCLAAHARLQGTVHLVRHEYPKAVGHLTEGKLPLLEEVTAELEPCKDDPRVENIWERVEAQVRVITFEELESRVTQRVWDQVVGGPIFDSKELVYERRSWYTKELVYEFDTIDTYSSSPSVSYSSSQGVSIRLGL